MALYTTLAPPATCISRSKSPRTQSVRIFKNYQIGSRNGVFQSRKVACAHAGHEIATAVDAGVNGASEAAFNFFNSPLMPEFVKMMRLLATDALEIVMVVVLISFLQERCKMPEQQDELEAETAGTGVFAILKRAFTIVSRPMKAIVPFLIGLRALRHLIDGLDGMYHVVHDQQRFFPAYLDDWLHAACHDVSRFETFLSQGTFVLLLQLGIWVLLRMLRLMFRIIIERAVQKEGKEKGQQMREVLIPMQTIVSWVLVVAGVLSGLDILGVNIKPILTVMGGSSIIVGLASQQILANCFSGLNLLLFRPIITGDRIVLYAGNGSVLASGVVERIEPLRTVIRSSDQELPTAIPNKLFVENMISNESRGLANKTPSRHFMPFRRTNLNFTFGLSSYAKLGEALPILSEGLGRFANSEPNDKPYVSLSVTNQQKLRLVVQITAERNYAKNSFPKFQRDVLLWTLHELNMLGLTPG